MPGCFSVQAYSTNQLSVEVSTPRIFEYTADEVIKQGGNPFEYGNGYTLNRCNFSRGNLNITSPSDGSSLVLNAESIEIFNL